MAIKTEDADIVIENKTDSKVEDNTGKRTSGFAIAAFVLGILSLLFGWSVFFGIVFGIVSIIFAIVAFSTKSKAVFAVLGLVFSTLGIITAIVTIILFATIFKNVDDSFVDALAQVGKELASEEVIDDIKSNSWVTKDDSLLVFDRNGEYKYYRDKNDKKDYYYEGTYKILTGDKAINYIANDLKKYGVTEQEQKDIIEKRKGKTNNEEYICIVLTNKKCMVNGENTMEEEVVAPYFGFYDKDKKALDIVNMNNSTNYYFTTYNK